MRQRFLALAPAVIRLTVFATVVAILLFAFLSHLVGSHIERSVMDAGSSLLTMTESAPAPGGRRTLVLNGHELHFRTGVDDQSPASFLRHYKRGCYQEHEGRDEVAVVDELAGGRGYVGCALIRDASEVIVRKRIESQEQPGYRFVYAEPGSQARTRFIEMWTDEPLALVDIFPGRGDSPGSDIPGVARPMQSRRLLSAHEQGYGQRVAVYQSEMRETDLIDFYKSFFERDGLEVVTTRNDQATAVVGVDRDHLYTVVVGRSGEHATVTVLASL